MARRILSHKALRADFEAAERRKKETQGEGEDQNEEQEDEEEEGAEAADGESGEEAEAAPAKKKKAKPVKEPKPKRTRTAKVIRQRVVWAVFNNSNARVQTFAYPQKKEADEYAAKMIAEKGSTFFVQPIKEPIEEKKEKD